MKPCSDCGIPLPDELLAKLGGVCLLCAQERKRAEFLDAADGLLKAAQSVMSESRGNSKSDGVRTVWDGSYRINNREILALYRAISNYVKLRSKA